MHLCRVPVRTDTFEFAHVEFAVRTLEAKCDPRLDLVRNISAGGVSLAYGPNVEPRSVQLCRQSSTIF
jgi:hypothetical protein